MLVESMSESDRCRKRRSGQKLYQDTVKRKTELNPRRWRAVRYRQALINVGGDILWVNFKLGLALHYTSLSASTVVPLCRVQ